MRVFIDKGINFIYVVAVGILIVLLCTYFYSTYQVKISENRVQHTQEVMAKSNIVLLDVVDIETGSRGYYLTKNEIFLKPYYKALQNSKKNLENLQSLTEHNKTQHKNVVLLTEQVEKKLERCKNLIDATRNSKANKVAIDIDLNQGQAISDSIRSLISKINNAEDILLKKHKLYNGKSANASDLLLGIIFLFIAIIIILLFYIFRSHRRATIELAEFNAIQNSAAKYSLSLIEASRDPLFTISPSGKITGMNQATADVTGVEREDLIGSDFYSYFTDPDKAKQGTQEIFNQGFVSDFPLTIKDHVLTEVLFNGSVYKNENNVTIGAVVVARDITEQKKAEQNLLEYKRLFDENLDFACIANAEGYFEIVNKTFIDVLGYSENELLSNKFLSFVFPEDLESTEAVMEELLQGVPAVSFINRYYKKDGTLVVLEWKSNYNVTTNKLYAVARDITIQKELEKELIEAKIFAELATTIAEDAKENAEQAKVIAEEAVISKQQFLSNMSHEIRTPMNAIIGFTKVVLKTELSAKQKEYLTAIKISGDSLILLINDILDLAKVNSGKMTFEQTAFKLAHSLKTMLHLFETKVQEKNLQLITKYDENIPAVLVGDAIRLHQIILNLVSNAVKFTSEGTITVSVDLLSQDDDIVRVQISVIDTGIGISPSKVGSVFDNFQQATNSTSRLYGGTGLGLAIVKQLVEAQGGSIKIESEIDKGSTFSFVLDFAKTDQEVAHEPEIVELDIDINSINILVVEDMELNQLLMKTLLDDFGFECDIAANGKLAIEKLKTKTYDIILMDLQMPEMNGFEATEYIRNTMKSDIPIIALTADVTTVDVQKCKAVGMNDYVSKPVDERLLYSKLISYYKKPVVIIEQVIEGKTMTEKVKYVDMSYLTKLTKSDPELMSQMINAYLKQTPPLIEAMKKSVADKDWKSLQAAVHKMIPSFSIIGLNPNVLDIAKRIQEYAYSIEISQEILNLVLELENVCTVSFDELQIELLNLKNL